MRGCVNDWVKELDLKLGQRLDQRFIEIMNIYSQLLSPDKCHVFQKVCVLPLAVRHREVDTTNRIFSLLSLET